MQILQCKNLTYSIGYRKILKNISFELKEKECVLLMGENGTGKSTLFKVLSNYNSLKDNFIFHESIIQLIRTKKRNLFSYLGHELGLYFSLTLKENLDYFYGVTENGISKSKILELVDRFNLTKRLNDPIHTFSRGMKQKSALIRTFIANPIILLLDEPFTGLDQNSIQILKELISEFKQNNTTFIINHDLEEMKILMDRKFDLKNGEIV